METGCPSGPSAVCDVLIVEDDPVQREEMADFLSRVGLVVAVAPGSAAALALVAATVPKVLVLDYNLPDGNGIDLAEKLRVLLPNASIMLASARLESLSDEVIDRIGIAAFLNKPLPLVEWRQAVVHLVQHGPPPPGDQDWLPGGFGNLRPRHGR